VVRGFGDGSTISGKSEHDPDVMSFVEVAQDFCRLLERKTRLSPRGFLRRVLKSTVALYGAGLKLPNVDPDRGYHPGGQWFEKNKRLPIQELIKLDPQVQEHSRRHKLILRKIIRSLGGELRYQIVFDPFQDRETVSSTLSDDLAGIYCDVKEGLLNIKSSRRVSSSVIWQWKCDFESHWGRHAVSAINAMHCRLYSVPFV
jgi:hypothetical protein